MITIRTLVEEDRTALEDSISKDRYHKDYLKSDFFYAPDTYTGVYEVMGNLLFMCGLLNHLE